MIERLSHEYDNFFDEPRYQVRWDRLKALYSKDYLSFRVLFVVETLGLLDKWREPTPRELNAILRHKMAGGQVAIRIGRVIDLFQPVWPLEVAKYEYLVHRATWDSTFRRKYFMTSIRSYATALVQTWWAFETLMNDFASIIAKERHATLDSTSLALLEEKRPTIDKTGVPSLESYYQPLMPRLQFIYRLLTGEVLDRGATEWRDLLGLKDTRDAYIHRVGKQSSQATTFGMDAVIVNGFSAVRSILGQVLTKTPEFAAKFVYRYLAFWSCGSESPFIWDGSEGGSFYLGLGNVRKEMVVGLFAPMPGSFSAERTALPSTPAVASARTTPSTGRKREPRKRSH
ncbi:MAG: hypothetical protein AAB037_00620 [Chloroflexota bacterium]